MRIDPDKTPELFQRIGKKPLRKKWFNKTSCCILSALCIDNGLPKYRAITIYNLKSFGYSYYYQLGLRHGWDGLANCYLNKDYLEGQDDGKAAWEKMK